MRNAIPLREVAGVGLGSFRQLRVELQGLQTLVATVLVDDIARLFRLEHSRRVVAVGKRPFGGLLERADRGLVVEGGNTRAAGIVDCRGVTTESAARVGAFRSRNRGCRGGIGKAG